MPAPFSTDHAEPNSHAVMVAQVLADQRPASRGAAVNAVVLPLAAVNKKIAAKFADKVPARPGVFAVDDRVIGGWRNADKVWFDPNKGRMAKIEQAVGGPSSG